MNDESAKYTAKKAAKMPVISRAEDRGESIAEMEPLLIGDNQPVSWPFDRPRRRTRAEISEVSR